MSSLYLNYKEWVTGGEILDPDDRWSDRSPEHKDFQPLYLFLDRDNAGTFAHGLTEDEIYGDFESGDTAHLVYVSYQTGDTFGYSTGNWYIIGAFKDPKEAARVANEIDSNPNEGADEYILYRCWNGYFERYEGVTVTPVLVR